MVRAELGGRDDCGGSEGDGDHSELLARIVEEFVERVRGGQQPAIDPYLQRYPEHADELRVMLAAVGILHIAQPVSWDRTDELREAGPPESLGDYQILGEIGRGGMGVVYEAHQKSLDRRVALKVLPRHAASHASAPQRFLREARAAAALHHTNIVPVFEVGCEGDTYFYAMQYIAGQSLDEVFRDLQRNRADTGKAAPADETPGRNSAWATATRQGNYDDTQPQVRERPADATGILRSRRHYYQRIAELGYQTASALGYAHQRGTIHRDIKPSNLILDSNGTVWVTDFGLAKFEEDGLTRSGDLLGTLRYMSPERFRGQCDERADVYGLGVVLYELATLRRAFDSFDRLKLVEMISQRQPPPPRVIAGDLPRDLETIILKAMEKDPSRRYESADLLAEDLRRFLHDEPIRARRTSALEHLKRWVRHNRMAAASLGFLALLLLATALGSTIAAGWYQNLAGERQHLVEKLGVQVREANAAKSTADSLRSVAESERTRAKGEKERAERETERAQRESSRLAFDRALRLCDEREYGAALHWMLRSLQLAHESDIAWRTMLRANLAGWLPQVQGIRWISPFDDGFNHSNAGTVVIDPANEYVLVGWLDARSARFRRFDLNTGMEGSPLEFPRSEPYLGVDWNSETLLFLPDGHRALAGLSSHDRSIIQCFGYPDWQPLSEPIFLGAAMTSTAISPDGKRFATCIGPDHLEIGEIEPLRVTCRLPVRRGSLCQTVRFLDNDRMLVGRSPISHFESDTSVEKENLFGVEVVDCSGQAIGNFLPHGATSMALTADHKWIALACDDKTIRQYEVESRQPIAPAIRLRESNAEVIRFTPDCRQLILVSGRDFIHFVDAGVADPDHQRIGSAIRCDVTPDGATIVVSSLESRVLRCLAAARPAVLAKLPGGAGWPISSNGRRYYRPSNLTDGRGAGAFSTDGKTAGIQVADHVCQLIDVKSGGLIGPPLWHPFQYVDQIQFSPDGRLVATSCHGQNSFIAAYVRLWDARSGAPRSDWLPHSNFVSAMRFTPDGRQLATGDYSGWVQLFNVDEPSAPAWKAHQGAIVTGLQFVSQGKSLLVSRWMESLRWWDIVSGREQAQRAELATKVQGVAPGGGLILATGVANELYFLRADDASQQFEPLSLPGIPACCALSPDGRLAAFGQPSGELVVVDLRTGRPATGAWRNHEAAVGSVAFDPLSQRLAAGYADGATRVIDLATFQPLGPPIYQPEGAPVIQVAFSADGRSLLTLSNLGPQNWPLALPLQGPEDALALRIQRHTGEFLDDFGNLHPLSPSQWTRLDRRLRQEASNQRQAADERGPPVAAFELPHSDAAWHDGIAFQAETDNRTDTALWHLQRLSDLRPEDWSVKARYAQQLAKDMQYERALQLYGHADFTSGTDEDSARRERLLAWYHLRAVHAASYPDWQLAQWYLDRWSDLSPKDPPLHAMRALLAHRRDDPTVRDAEYEQALENGLEPELALAWPALAFQDAERKGFSPGDVRRVAQALKAVYERSPLVADYLFQTCVMVPGGDGWLNKMAADENWPAVDVMLDMWSQCGNPLGRYYRTLVASQLGEEERHRILCGEVVEIILREMPRLNGWLESLSHEQAIHQDQLHFNSLQLLWFGAMCVQQDSEQARRLSELAEPWGAWLEASEMGPSQRYQLQTRLALIRIRAGQFAEAHQLLNRSDSEHGNAPEPLDELLSRLVELGSVEPTNPAAAAALKQPVDIAQTRPWPERLELRKLWREIQHAARSE